MHLHSTWVSLGLYASAFPVCYTLSNMPALNQTGAVFLTAFTILAVFSAALVFHVLSPTKEPLLHVFLVLSFISGIDAVIALEQEGYISNFAEFYLKEGEAYLTTTYGTMLCSWDAMVHYPLYLLLTLAIEQRTSFRNFGLFWLGSFVISLVIFLLGSLVGKYGSEIRPSFLLNLSFLFVSMWIAKRIFQQPKPLPIVPADKVSAEQRKTLLQRPLDLGLVAFLTLAIVFTLFRGLVALDCPADMCFDYIYQQEPYLRDPVAYPKVQMLVYLFYALPFFCVCVYGLLSPGCTWMPDGVLVCAGAIAQAQFCHIVGSFHHRTPFPYRTPQEAWWFVVLSNVAFAVGPQVLVYRCLRQPAFFCRPVDQDDDKKSR